MTGLSTKKTKKILDRLETRGPPIIAPLLREKDGTIANRPAPAAPVSVKILTPTAAKILDRKVKALFNDILPSDSLSTRNGPPFRFFYVCQNETIYHPELHRMLQPVVERLSAMVVPCLGIGRTSPRLIAIFCNNYPPGSEPTGAGVHCDTCTAGAVVLSCTYQR
jgi:hypothetical protein